MDFRYEQLPDFCFYCGCVGHVEKGCEQRRVDVAANRLKIGQYGLWMRAGYGRIVHVGKEKAKEHFESRVEKNKVCEGERRMDSDKQLQGWTEGGERENNTEQVLVEQEGETGKEGSGVGGDTRGEEGYSGGDL